MDDLLAEALRDFEEQEGEGQERPAATSPRPACSSASPIAAPVISGETTSTSDSVAPAAQPAHRGPSLPPQAKRKQAKPLEFDPLGPKGPKTAAAPAACSTSGSGAPAASGGRPAAGGEPKLPRNAQQLADDLMRLLEESGLGEDGPGGPGGDLSDLGDSFLKAIADLEVGGGGDLGGELGAAIAAAAAGGAGSPVEQEAFSSAALQGLAAQTRSTVDKQSKFSRGEGSAASSSARAQGATGAGGGFPFGDLLGALGSMAGPGGGDGPGTNMMVDYIMQNLLSKEVLYGPLKDIRDKYPPWLESHREGMSLDEVQRYTAQYTSIQAVCTQYEEDPANFSRLVELIQQMQTYGDPPSEIVDEMTGGGMPAGLMGATDAADDIGNFDLPPDFAEGLPKELQDKCCIM